MEGDRHGIYISLKLELGMIDLVEEDAGYISVAGLILDKTHGDKHVGTQLTIEVFTLKCLS